MWSSCVCACFVFGVNVAVRCFFAVIGSVGARVFYLLVKRVTNGERTAA